MPNISAATRILGDVPKPTQPRAAKGGRSMLQAQIYLIVIVVLSVPAMAITQLWAIAATQIGAHIAIRSAQGWGLSR